MHLKIYFFLLVGSISAQKLCKLDSSDDCSCFSEYDEILVNETVEIKVDCKKCTVIKSSIDSQSKRNRIYFRDCSEQDFIKSLKTVVQSGNESSSYGELDKNQDSVAESLVKEIQAKYILKELNVNDYAGHTKLPIKFFVMFTYLSAINYENNSFPAAPKDIFFNSENVFDVSLARNQLETLSVDLIANLTKLETLDLSHNEIMIIPEHFFKSSQFLKRLRMSYNKLQILSE